MTSERNCRNQDRAAARRGTEVAAWKVRQRGRRCPSADSDETPRRVRQGLGEQQGEKEAHKGRERYTRAWRKCPEIAELPSGNVQALGTETLLQRAEQMKPGGERLPRHSHTPRDGGTGATPHFPPPSSTHALHSPLRAMIYLKCTLTH